MTKLSLNYLLPTVVFGLLSVVACSWGADYLVAILAFVIALVTHIYSVCALRTDDIDEAQDVKRSLLNHAYALAMSLPIFIGVIVAPIAIDWIQSLF